MRALVGCLVVISSISCAGREYRTYPDNGSMQYLDCSVQAVGGNLDATGVTMHYKGKLADSVESLGPLEAKASKRGVKKMTRCANCIKKKKKNRPTAFMMCWSLQMQTARR